MLRISEDRNVSLKLSEVLSDIGVNERIVRMRRKYTVVQESLFNLKDIFINSVALRPKYIFGSRSEGSTTIGLDSDLDEVLIDGNIHVIQDWAEWKHGVMNLLIVQDETTSPGYSLLQLLRSDTPLAATHIVNNKFLTDDKGRILYKNAHADVYLPPAIGMQHNGPADTLEGLPGRVDIDAVQALYCESWPEEGRGWLDRECVGNWPGHDIKRLAMRKGCFLVPVGSKLNNLDDVEWRISTSVAERLMMFDLNITQIRCYVMMKLISKTFFTINRESTITSFMCKCILFHCIETTHAHYWCEDNLLSCVMKCLCTLHDCVQSLNCPHFIIPANNLMAQRINSEQQRYLMHVLSSLINFNTDMLFAIQIDNFGERLQMKLTNVLPSLSNVPSQLEADIGIVSALVLNNGRVSCRCFQSILFHQSRLRLPETTSKLVEGIQTLQSQYHTFSDIAVEACTYFVPLLCSFVGSLLASFSVYTSNTISRDAIWWLTAGFDSDVSSSRLKLASAFYCVGDINSAELTLRELEQNYTDVVIAECVCYPFEYEPVPVEKTIHLYRNKELLNKSIAYCVNFVRCEAPIIPHELRQELFRSTEIEFQNRSHWNDRWMDFAVVDSLPYLYFLLYKVYKHQGRLQQQKKALSNLLRTTLNERNLGHRETAWNLLGQCMEQENLPVDALWCYQRSLALRPYKNAANFNMARLHRL